MKRFQIEVPATSANLGPGFDCLGIALNIVDTIVCEIDPENAEEPQLSDGTGETAGSRCDLIRMAYQRYGDDAGINLPAANFRLESRIPIGKGFGSSAAAIVGGLVAAAHVMEAKAETSRLLHLAARLDGHSDNVAPALMGGLTVSVQDGQDIRALAVAQHFSFGVVLFVPDEALRTSDARAVLPAAVPHADAAFNVARAAYLVAALSWGRWDELAVAMDDRLHQTYRAALVSALQDVISAARKAGAYGAALSGAGPSVIAFCPPSDSNRIGDAMAAQAHAKGWEGNPLVTSVREFGARVKPLE